MKKNIIVFMIYLLAVAMNFITSIKYPDATITVFNLVMSMIFLISIILMLKSVIPQKKVRFAKIAMMSGACSSIFVFIATQFQHMNAQNMILDVVSGLHYPLYVLFVTPLFGLNYMFNFSSGLFSATVSIFYLTGFGLTVYLIKKH